MENKNIELENQNNEVKENETQKTGLLAKVGNGVKKHWKGALLALGAGALGFILGGKAVKGGSEDTDCDAIEIDDFTVEENDE